jgi:hypothetical protein
MILPMGETLKSAPSQIKRCFIKPTTVDPAECSEKLKPDFFSNLWTSAISVETEAVGVPIGMRQKSAMQAAGVLSFDKSTLSFDFELSAAMLREFV